MPSHPSGPPHLAGQAQGMQRRGAPTALAWCLARLHEAKLAVEPNARDDAGERLLLECSPGSGDAER